MVGEMLLPGRMHAAAGGLSSKRAVAPVSLSSISLGTRAPGVVSGEKTTYCILNTTQAWMWLITRELLSE